MLRGTATLVAIDTTRHKLQLWIFVHKKYFQPFFQKFRKRAKRKPFRGMFQSLKSYRFAYISVICINVIYDFVIVLVSFTSWWSSPKCQDHFDILTCCFLQQSWNGQEVAINVCDNLLSPKSTIIINVWMWAGLWGAPFGVKWTIEGAESHCSLTTMIGGAAFHENTTWSVSIPFFLVKNVLKA